MAQRLFPRDDALFVYSDPGAPGSMFIKWKSRHPRVVDQGTNIQFEAAADSLKFGGRISELARPETEMLGTTLKKICGKLKHIYADEFGMLYGKRLRRERELGGQKKPKKPKEEAIQIPKSPEISVRLLVDASSSEEICPQTTTNRDAFSRPGAVLEITTTLESQQGSSGQDATLDYVSASTSIQYASPHMFIHRWEVVHETAWVQLLKVTHNILAGCPVLARVKGSPNADKMILKWFQALDKGASSGQNADSGATISNKTLQSGAVALVAHFGDGNKQMELNGFEELYSMDLGAEGPSFDPSASLVGQQLIAVALPYDSQGRLGLPAVYCPRDVVQKAPDTFVFDEVHAMTGERLKGDGLRVVSYNVLADLYVKAGPQGFFPYCPVEAIKREYRLPLLMRELRGSTEEHQFVGKELQHSLGLKSACGTPEFTNFTADFKGCLDYIFADGSMDVQKVYPLPAEESLTHFTAIPSWECPSDHVALVCDLRFTGNQ